MAELASSCLGLASVRRMKIIVSKKCRCHRYQCKRKSKKEKDLTRYVLCYKIGISKNE